ncbi:MAG: rhodanese-like domain-containing protein [Verrucomicrobia bacterium]|nr:rhodanese-like domain-containing protein [Verrucomicrobiota bacterium]
MSASSARATLRDSVAVALAGVALGLIANAVSPRGLALRRDYFSAVAPVAAVTPAPTASSGLSAARRARLGAQGIALLSHERAVGFFRDPLFTAGRIVFIDARDEAHYAAGHIPGARPFDHYRLDKYVADILGACAAADRIVVYCNGGECEDSELAAGDLLQFGVPAAKLFVYAGGIAEWREKNLPLETGPRGGGHRVAP